MELPWHFNSRRRKKVIFILLLLFASVKRFSVSRMRDFFFFPSGCSSPVSKVWLASRDNCPHSKHRSSLSSGCVLCAVCLRSTLCTQLLPLWCCVRCVLGCRLFAESHRNYVYREVANKRTCWLVMNIILDKSISVFRTKVDLTTE